MKQNNTMFRFLSSMLIATSMSCTIVAYADGSPVDRTVSQSVTALRVTGKVMETSPKSRSGITIPKPRRLTDGHFRVAKPEMTHKRMTRPRGAVARAGRLYPEFMGACMYSDTWESAEDIGVYTVPTSETRSFDYIIPANYASYGAIAKDGVYYTTDWVDLWGMGSITSVAGYDIATGAKVYAYDVDTQDVPILSVAMALHPLTNEIYGINYVQGDDDSLGLRLVKVEYGATGTEPVITPVCDLPQYEWCAMAINSEGVIYAIAKEIEDYTIVGSTLYQINPSDGQATAIGPTGQYPEQVSGAVIDTSTDRMFWAVNPDDYSGFLTEVDLTTGEAVEVYDFPDCEQVNGLTIAPAAAADKAPDALQSFRINYSEGSRECEAEIVAPVTCYDTSDAEGTLTITVTANGDVIALLTDVEYGAELSIPFEVEESGRYKFTAFASNEVGDGPVSRTRELFIGTDTPLTPEVQLSYADGIMSLVWDEISSSVNDQDLEDVTYTVTRFPDDIVVAEGLDVTAFSEPVDVPETGLVKYYYTVVAVCDDARSEAGKSNYITIGVAGMPYSSDFENEGLEGFAVVDANNDGITWQPFGEYTRVSYNANLDADDWLITPALRLEKGKSYMVSFRTFSAGLAFPEKIEVKWGKGNTPVDMDKTLLEPTELKYNVTTPLDVAECITPEEDGVYYIGFHCISEKNRLFLYLGNIHVSAGVLPAAPAAVTNLIAEAVEHGELCARLSFTAPEYDLSGNSLSSIDRIEVSRDDEVKAVIDNPMPGSEQNVTVTEEMVGLYTYLVTAYNSIGAGRTAEVTVFVGVDYPASLTRADIARTDNVGEVTVSWDEVSADVNGKPLESDLVTYNLYLMSGDNMIPVDRGITSTSYTFRAVYDGQDFVQCFVEPCTARGNGEGRYTAMIPVGVPYRDFHESFADGNLTYLWTIDQNGGAIWGVASDDSFKDIKSSDADNGFVFMKATAMDEYASLTSGLISLEGITEPGLTFYTFNTITEEGIVNNNNFRITVDALDGTAPVEVLNKTVNEMCHSNEGWNKVTVNLGQYVDKTITFTITPECKGFAIAPIDNICVGSIPACDLAAIGVSAPVSAFCGTEFDINVRIANEGARGVDMYDVELYADNTQVSAVKGSALNPGDEEIITFSCQMPPLAEQPVEYYAVLRQDKDTAEDNNKSAIVAVRPKTSLLPDAGLLESTAGESEIALSWAGADESQIGGRQITADMEDGEPFANEYRDWTFVDADNMPVGGIQNVDIPGITPGTTTGSFWLWDASELGNETFDAHSGNKYMFSMFRADDGMADDWAISPELDGKPQIISLYAKSYSSTYKEMIEILYSTGSTDIESFVRIDDAGGIVPASWTLFEASLPAGARRFAIRSVATGALMLMVDDISYAPAGAAPCAVLKGYDIYRDGIRLNDVPVCDTYYTDKSVVKDTEYSYTVLASYDNGVSRPSNTVTSMLNSDSVAEITAGITIEAVDGYIIIRNAEDLPVSVTTPGGVSLYNGYGKTETRIHVSDGIYIVKAGDYIRKIIL